MTAYKVGTMMMIQAVIDRIGCAAAMPKDHKNEWLQNRFSLYPAGRIQKPNGKGTNLVWREADVEKARRLWIGRAENQPLVFSPQATPAPSAKAEAAAISQKGPRGWISDQTPHETGLRMIALAEQLLQQAAALLARPHPAA